MKESRLARLGPIVLAALLAAQVVSVGPFDLVHPAAATTASSFGAPGLPLFQSYLVDGGGVPAGEPTLGIAHHVGTGKDAMYQATFQQFRLGWNDGVMPPSMTSTDVTSPFLTASALSGNLWDPILYTSPETGRTWAGQLALACSSLPQVAGAVLPAAAPVVNAVDPGCPFSAVCNPAQWAVNGGLGPVGLPLGVATVVSPLPPFGAASGAQDPLDCAMNCDMQTQTVSNPQGQPLAPGLTAAIQSADPNAILAFLQDTQASCDGNQVMPGTGPQGHGLPVGQNCTANMPCQLTTSGCSIMSYTSDNAAVAGADWLPMGNPCALPAWDHESIGSGPWAVPVPTQATYAEGVYYCAQFGDIYCWISYDGGNSFVPSMHMEQLRQANTNCVGIHGHIRVSPTDGTIYLPDKWCSGRTGMIVSNDNGQSWNVRTIPPVGPTGLTWPSGTGFHDPSIGIDRAGTIFVGQTENGGSAPGAYIAVSHTKGVTWEDVGTEMGAPAGTKYFNVASLVPGLGAAEFAEVIAGDPGRAAFAFLGGTGSGPSGNCGAGYVWHLYVAMTYDDGRSWSVTRATADPVQRGGIWPGGGGAVCRNLLDFNDIVVDREGRVVISYTDGCVSAACTGAGGNPTFESIAAVARQYTGRGLYLAFDTPGDFGDAGSRCVPSRPEVVEETPGEGALVLQPSPDFKGFVDRHRTPGPIAANANGPYEGTAESPFRIHGSADCVLDMGFSCEWFPIEHVPVFSPGPQDCDPDVTYAVDGPAFLQLKVTDLRTGSTDTAIAAVNVLPRNDVVVPPPPPTGTPPTGASCPLTQDVLIDEDPDNDHNANPTTGVNEITCFGAEYDAGEDGIQFQVQVADAYAPTSTGADSHPEEYWISFDTDFAGTGYIVQVVWDGLAPQACMLLVVAPAQALTSAGGGPADSGCDPTGFLTAGWNGNTLEVTVPSGYLTGGGFPVGGRLTNLYANAWHSASNPNWGGCGTACVQADAANGGTYYAGTGEVGLRGGIGPYWTDDDYSPDCAGYATLRFITATTFGVSASCNPATPITATAPGSSAAPPVAVLTGAGSNWVARLMGAVATVAQNPVPAAQNLAQNPVGSVLRVAPTFAVQAVQGAPSLQALARPLLGIAPLAGLLNQPGNAPPGTMARAAPSANGESTTAGYSPLPCDAPRPLMPALVAAPPEEFVRLIPDWDFYNPSYLSVDTSVASHQDWTSKLAPFSPPQNGLHLLWAEWYDQSGARLLASDCMAFDVEIPQTVSSIERPAPAPDERDSHIRMGDVDKDGFADGIDNCPQLANNQDDLDGDGTGDACDNDMDGDGVPNLTDNCASIPNPDHKDTDGDGVGDACDPDSDGDGIPDVGSRGPLDNCRLTANPGQEDRDGNGVGDACQVDSDGDGVPDYLDAFPFDALESRDDNQDGLGDRANPVTLAKSAPALKQPATAFVALASGLGPQAWGFLLLAALACVALFIVVARRRM